MELPQTNLTEPPADPLSSLPPELLLIIFAFVGAENFRRDVRRLAVSKKWYAYARQIFLSNIHLESSHLMPMLRAMRKSATLAAAQQLTKRIELTMQSSWPRGICPGAESVSRFEQLASTLEDFTALRTLVIRPQNFVVTMPIQMMISFASLTQLKSLEIDLTGNHFWGPTTPHHCESIGQLMPNLPNLKSLRCRLHRICNKLLTSPPGDLEELIICLSTDDWFDLVSTHPPYHPITGPHDELWTRLEMPLLQFAASMRDPKIVRLIYKSYYDSYIAIESYAFDAISGFVFNPVYPPIE